MDDIIKMLKHSEFCRQNSSFIIIAIILGIAFLLSLKFRRTSIDLIIKVLAVIIGILVMYGIIWYMNQVSVVEY